MNRRMVSNKRSGSVTFWAWTASVVVHLVVLTVFGVARFSQLKAQDRQQPVPTARVSWVKKLIETVPIVPKPKIK
ncbi:unnamed protein product, partial [marine sediment metagenome]